MTVSLSIKGVPEALVERLRRRAAGNHRSLQRELMAIVEAAVQPQPRAVKPSAQLPAPPRRAAESEGAWHVTAAAGAGDSLLEELDAIVDGSRWGEAPVLTREQANDRALAREFDFESRQVEPPVKPRQGGAR